MTVFDGEPRCHIGTCYLYPNENVVFGILKAIHFQYDAFGGQVSVSDYNFRTFGAHSF
jgi:hypothetical protein